MSDTPAKEVVAEDGRHGHDKSVDAQSGQSPKLEEQPLERNPYENSRKRCSTENDS